MIESTTKDGVAVLTMRHGKANALDTELCQALCGTLEVDAIWQGLPTLERIRSFMTSLK